MKGKRLIRIKLRHMPWSWPPRNDLKNEGNQTWNATDFALKTISNRIWQLAFALWLLVSFI